VKKTKTLDNQKVFVRKKNQNSNTNTIKTIKNHIMKVKLSVSIDLFHYYYNYHFPLKSDASDAKYFVKKDKNIGSTKTVIPTQ
jgi:hypothetical protein